MKNFVLSLMLLTAVAGTAFAQDDDGGNSREQGRRGPPPEALEACSAAVSGDPCSFEGRRGETLDGTCEAPEDKPLACRPANAPEGRNQLH